MQNNIQENYDLTKLNTLRLGSRAKYFFNLIDIKQLYQVADFIKQNNSSYFVLGGGSNLILPKMYDGLVIYNKLRGITQVESNDKFIIIEVMAGEIWDDFVDISLENGWFGLENLSLIPGTVGASPIQNIGAYGVEVGQFIQYVKVFDLLDSSFKVILHNECQFDYRTSIFKTHSNYVVIAVGFSLLKQSQLNLSYVELANRMSDNKNSTAQSLRDCVIKIRQAKLPDPKVIANVGSFFHNPIITKEYADKLKLKYVGLPVYEIDDKFVKISAGWLIDNLGLKGYKKDNMGVYEKQALVLVNYGACYQDEVLDFASIIQEKVEHEYSIRLNIEPMIIRE